MKLDICDNIEEEMKNNLIKIIEESFEQEEKKPCDYVSNQLKKLYPDEKWNIIFIHQENSNSCSTKTKGSIFLCKYKDYRIIIYPSNIKAKNVSKGEKTEEIGLSDKEKDNIQNKLIEAKKLIKKYESEIEELKRKIEQNNNKLESSQKKIIEKDNMIKTLENKLENKNKGDPFRQTFYTRDEMFALNFKSIDSRINYAISCPKKDLFVDVEKKLYDKFPEYKETNNNFVVQGKAILRFKTIEENKLENGIPILIIQNKNN